MSDDNNKKPENKAPEAPITEKKKPTYSFSSVEANTEELDNSVMKSSAQDTLLTELIKRSVGTSNNKKAPRLAFTDNPVNRDQYAGIYKLKANLLPEIAIKQIRVQNLLIAAILRARGNTLSMMGHFRKDRFDVGLELNIKDEFKDYIEPEQMIRVQDRMDRMKRLIVNCGSTDGLNEDEKITLSEYLDISTRNGLSFGTFATEIVRDNSGKFHRFRPLDAGSIYRAYRKGENAEAIRRSSIKFLEQSLGEHINISIDRLNEDEYSWVQVIEGIPRQAFTHDEMIVYNLYPSSDIEHNGYPVTPMDTIVNQILTYMSIETYNKLYFQNGRAAKGMVVIQSDEIEASVLEDIKQQYNASINNVNNSFRTPIFGVGTQDQVNWVQTVPTKKDGEFMYLSDGTARNILAAFQMSPDELPGFTHLSKGTNSQALSESSSEWKLLAARDVGLRPLLLKLQDYFNEKLFPMMDPELAQLCYLSFSGLDAESKTQEATRLGQEVPLHYNYKELTEEVDKHSVGEHLGDRIPFNEAIRGIMNIYVPVNEVIGDLMDSPASFVDPIFQYKRDPFYFQHIANLAQYNPAAVYAYYATRADSFDLLKEFLQDYLDIEEEK